MNKYVLEYVWLDGDSTLRSKTRVLSLFKDMTHYKKITIDSVPKWNYDGSSTKQAFGSNSEIILKPQALYKCPFRMNEYSYLVMCDTYDTENNPLNNNHRLKATKIFDNYVDQKPWYGIEQEFFMIDNDTHSVLEIKNLEQIGLHYCGIGLNSKSRMIMEELLDACLNAGLNISGINAEVAVGQWEYQIGPVEGIHAGDQVWISRYILQRLAEEHNVTIDFSPKPIKGEVNGSGCHTNFSTCEMRIKYNESCKMTGLDVINKAIQQLEKKHSEHMEIYGRENNLRMTGTCETSSYDKFSVGVGSRGSSIRIPTDTLKNECGYFEDRRPGSNMDPYLVTSKIMETINC
jgi:glutamine synthetase